MIITSQFLNFALSNYVPQQIRIKILPRVHEALNFPHTFYTRNVQVFCTRMGKMFIKKFDKIYIKFKKCLNIKLKVFKISCAYIPKKNIYTI